MRNRVIVVPKDKNAEKLLDYDTATTDQLIELNISEKDFLFLYKEKIIALINQIGGVNVDDYEDDCILDRKAILNISSKLEVAQINFSRTHRQLLEKIISLFKEAISRNTGVYFFF